MSEDTPQPQPPSDEQPDLQDEQPDLQLAPPDGEPLPPRITSISPIGGGVAGGLTVTITGSRFQPGAEVYFGGTPSPSVTRVSASSVKAVTPPAAQTGTVPVTLINPDGGEATRANGFTYVSSEASLHAEVLGVSPLTVLEDTETEVIVRGRNLISAHTDGLVALRGPTRVSISTLNVSTRRDEATGIEELIFTVRVVGVPPLGAMERVAIQVLASLRPGAANDGVFESSRQMFVVLPRAVPVTIAFTDLLETDRPNLVVVAGRNLDGCWLDYGADATVHTQRSEDRNITGIVTVGDAQASAARGESSAAAMMTATQLTVRNASGVAVAQFDVSVMTPENLPLPDLMEGGDAATTGAPADATTTPSLVVEGGGDELRLALTPVPDQQMLAPTEEDSALHVIGGSGASSLFFDWSNFAIDIFDLDLNFVIINEVRLIPFFDGGGDTFQSPVLAQVGKLFRVRGAGLLLALRIEIIIQIRVVIIIGYRFDFGPFGYFNEFSGLYPFGIGSIVISFRVIVRIRFRLSALIAIVEPGGTLRVAFRLTLSLGIDFFLSPDRTSIRFDPDLDTSFRVNHAGIFPFGNNLLPCDGRFQLASENGLTAFADARGGSQSFYFPRAAGPCCLPWAFNLQLLRIAPGASPEIMQDGFRTEYCLNAQGNPDLLDVLIVSNRTPNGFPPPLSLEVEESDVVQALGRPVDEAGHSIPGAPLRDLTTMGFRVEFFLATTPASEVVDSEQLKEGDVSAILPGENVIRVAASKLSRVIDEETGEELPSAFWPGAVLGFDILSFISRGMMPAVRAGNLPIIVASLRPTITVEPTLAYLDDPAQPATVHEAPVLAGVTIPNPSRPQQSLAVRELERNEPFQTQRTYVLGFRLNHQGGAPLPQQFDLKFTVTTVRMQVLPLGTSAPQTLEPLKDIPQVSETFRVFQPNRISPDVSRYFSGKLVQTQQFTFRVTQAPAPGQLLAVALVQGTDGLFLLPNHKEGPPNKLVPPGPKVADRHVLLSIDVKVESNDVNVTNQQSSVAAAVVNEENFEEYLRVFVEPQGLLAASPALAGFPAAFYQTLVGATTLPGATLLNAQGTLLWNRACAEMPTHPDDRPLYWARLQAIAALRAFFRTKTPPLTGTLIREFEWPSRGLDRLGVISFSDPNFADAGAASAARRAIVTGYDPFFLPDTPDTSNPSGLVALHLNRKTFSPERAVFIRADDTTQGNWRGTYGTDGYTVIADAASTPSYATAPSPAGHSSHTWAPVTTEPRALQKASGTERLAACWFGAQFTIDLDLLDGKPHRVALYLLDWDGNNGRAETIEVLDAATNAVLDTRSVSAFSGGIYLIWELSGHVKFRLTNTGPTNAVVSGVFFDTPTSGGGGVYVRSAIFPVRYADFDDPTNTNNGILEKAMLPNINSVVMIMTCSRGGDNYDVDRFAARNRGPKKFTLGDPQTPGTNVAAAIRGNNLIDNNRGLKTELTEPPGATPGPQYIETTLPATSVITQDVATRELPAPQSGTPPFTGGATRWFILKQSYWILDEPEVLARGKYEPPPTTLVNNDRTYDPTAVDKPGTGVVGTFRSFEGSGGNYLSNEIFYRTAALREKERPPLAAGEPSTLATGHLHLPFIGDPLTEAPGLVYSVRTAAERFLRFLFRMRGSVGGVVGSQISFPRTDVNSTSAPLTLKVTNLTKVTINVLPGNVSGPFQIQWPGPAPLPLPAYTSFNLPFTFRPTTPGTHTQTTTLNDVNGEQLLRITLTGKGTPVFIIAGRVTEANGNPVQGVEVRLTGGAVVTVQTGADGRYSFPNLPSGGNYTVTPSKQNYTFSPPSQTFSALGANQTGDFTATSVRRRIRGRVRTASGTGIPGATVTLSGSQTASTTSDSTGVYTFDNLPAGGNYTVTPMHPAYAFAPASQVFNNLTTDADFDFPGALVNYTIAGRATVGGAALAGVTVTLSGSQSANATTDANGNYSFTVVAQGNYTITPTLSGYEFTPVNRAYNALSSDQIGNFTAAPAVTPTPGSATVYDAVANFSAGQNPGGAWSYGYRAAGGGAFALLPNNDNLFGLPAGMHTWYVPNANNLPAVVHNGTGSTQSYFGATHPPGLLNLYPGGAGEKSVVRWTAQAAGTAQVAGRFQGLDATTTGVSVVKNGSITLASGNVNGLGNQAPFSFTLDVVAGDTIEFQVAYNGDVQHDSTGLAATVTVQPPALTFNAVNDFSPTQNQGAAWSYGYRAGGGAFALLPNNDNLYGLVAGMHTWYVPNANNLPAVIHNGTGATQSYYGATHPTDLLNLFPGGAGELSIVRWTAARAGTAQITGRFQGLDATTTGVSVVKNGSITLASGNVNGLGNQATFSLSVAVAAGDTIEFRVHNNGDVQHDSTGLAVAITLQ